MTTKLDNCFLVNAPAGSGKTTQIKKDLDGIRLHKPNDNILCITYTNRAADELAEGIDSSKIHVSTIHSFLSSYMEKFFFNPKVVDLFFEIYKDDIAERIANKDDKRNFKQSNDRYKEKHEIDTLDIEIIKNNINSIHYNERQFNSLYYGGLCHYDLISFTLRAMDRFPVINKRISAQYQHIFIDEYQDTASEVFFIFYNAVKDTSTQLHFLGDRMQQIYDDNDGSFQKKLLNFRVKPLSTNYRSSAKIVALLNKIYKDQDFIQKPSDEMKELADSCEKPKIIICKDAAAVETQIELIKEETENTLFLYLLNRERFKDIGSENLFNEYGRHSNYRYGSQHSAADVLTSDFRENPDDLLKLIYLTIEISNKYKAGNYGTIIQMFSNYKNIFCETTYNLTSHKDKIKLNNTLKLICEAIDDDTKNISELLASLKELNVARDDFIETILENEDYESIIDVNVQECVNLSNYLAQPNVSTQHGVKGESHNSVVFVASNNNRAPVTHMYSFFRMWAQNKISLPDFESFYFEYEKKLIELEEKIGMKISDLNSTLYKTHEEDISTGATHMVEQFENNTFFGCLCSSLYNKYRGKKNVTNAKRCFRLNIVSGTLAAYKLFYVGCSRARKRLTILLDESEMETPESNVTIDKQIAKFVELGFAVENQM